MKGIIISTLLLLSSTSLATSHNKLEARTHQKLNAITIKPKVAVSTADNFKKSIPSGQIISNCVEPLSFALTFDDGVSPSSMIPKYLESRNALGSFFVNGNNFNCIYDQAESDELIARYKAGHLIGSLTFNHVDITTLTAAQLNAEIDQVETAFSKILGIRPAFFRPPYGAYDDASLAILTARGYNVITWSADAGDDIGKTDQEIMQAYAELAAQWPQPQLMMNGEYTSEGFIPKVVPMLQALGYKLVTVDQCLGVNPYQVIGKPGIRDDSWNCDVPHYSTQAPVASSTILSTISSVSSAAVTLTTSVSSLSTSSSSRIVSTVTSSSVIPTFYIGSSSTQRGLSASTSSTCTTSTTPIVQSLAASQPATSTNVVSVPSSTSTVASSTVASSTLVSSAVSHNSSSTVSSLTSVATSSSSGTVASIIPSSVVVHQLSATSTPSASASSTSAISASVNTTTTSSIVASQSSSSISSSTSSSLASSISSSTSTSSLTSAATSVANATSKVVVSQPSSTSVITSTVSAGSSSQSVVVNSTPSTTSASTSVVVSQVSSSVSSSLIIPTSSSSSSVSSSASLSSVVPSSSSTLASSSSSVPTSSASSISLTTVVPSSSSTSALSSSSIPTASSSSSSSIVVVATSSVSSTSVAASSTSTSTKSLSMATLVSTKVTSTSSTSSLSSSSSISSSTSALAVVKSSSSSVSITSSSTSAAATVKPSVTSTPTKIQPPSGTVITACVKPSTIAMTYDDGPYDFGSNITNLLEEYNSLGTFFVNGNNWGCIYDYAEMLQARYLSGHQIASHTWTHADITKISAAQLNKELDLVETALKKILGIKPTTFRPPYGAYDDASVAILTKRGYNVVTWSLDSEDWRGAPASEAIQTYKTAIAQFPTPQISLNHETYSDTANIVMPAVIPMLIQKGYKLVTVSECLGIPAYYSVGKLGVRDSSWTCQGTPQPPSS